VIMLIKECTSLLYCMIDLPEINNDAQKNRKTGSEENQRFDDDVPQDFHVSDKNVFFKATFRQFNPVLRHLSS